MPAIAEQAEGSFRSAWPAETERPWPGPEYWTNPLQDWRIRHGRLECIGAGGDRNVSLLTREVSERSGNLSLEVRLGPLDAAPRERGFVGFRVGIRSAMGDYRAAALYGRGLNAGLSADGRLFIGTPEADAPTADLARELQLNLHAQPAADGYSVVLRAHDPQGGRTAEVRRTVPEEWLRGSVALVCSSGPLEPTPVPENLIRDFSFYPPNQQAGAPCGFGLQTGGGRPTNPALTGDKPVQDSGG